MMPTRDQIKSISLLEKMLSIFSWLPPAPAYNFAKYTYSRLGLSKFMPALAMFIFLRISSSILLYYTTSVVFGNLDLLMKNYQSLDIANKLDSDASRARFWNNYLGPVKAFIPNLGIYIASYLLCSLLEITFATYVDNYLQKYIDKKINSDSVKDISIKLSNNKEQLDAFNNELVRLEQEAREKASDTAKFGARAIGLVISIAIETPLALVSSLAYTTPLTIAGVSIAVPWLTVAGIVVPCASYYIGSRIGKWQVECKDAAKKTIGKREHSKNQVLMQVTEALSVAWEKLSYHIEAVFKVSVIGFFILRDIVPFDERSSVMGLYKSVSMLNSTRNINTVSEANSKQASFIDIENEIGNLVNKYIEQLHIHNEHRKLA